MSKVTFFEKNELSREEIAELKELMCLERSEISKNGTGLLELIAEQERVLEDLGVKSQELICPEQTEIGNEPHHFTDYSVVIVDV